MDRRATLNSKVLMITYVFPPAAWVGAHRTLKYCKYLGEHGWTPIVIAAAPIGVGFIDANLLRQLPPDVVVHRTFDVDPAKWESRLAERKLRRGRRAASDVANQQGTSSTQPTAEPPRVVALVKHFINLLKHFIKAVLKDSPDSHIFWVPFAFLRGTTVLLREKVDVIYCTTPPHSSHLAAYLLAKWFNKPYVLDFRDPWYVSGSVRTPVDKIPVLLKLETRIKRAIVRRAAKVICVSKGERDELRAEFPDLDDEHFVYITNGYDPADLSAEGSDTPRSARLSLVHAGTIYPGIAGELLDALRWLVENDPDTAQSIELLLLGEIAPDYTEAVRSLEASGVVKALGLQPHAKTLQVVRDGDVLVILMGGTKYLASHLPSKVFEYLCAGKPILAVAAEGELTQIVRRSGLGTIVPPQSVDTLVETLRTLVADRLQGRLARVPDRAYIRSFERAALAERLAGVLDAVKEAGRVRQQYTSR